MIHIDSLIEAFNVNFAVCEISLDFMHLLPNSGHGFHCGSDQDMEGSCRRRFPAVILSCSLRSVDLPHYYAL